MGRGVSFAQEAAAKLKREKGGKFDKYGEAMKGAVASALTELAAQDEDFARAVAHGGSFEECLKAVAKGIKGGSISDLDAFKRAVKHYDPEADVEFRMVLSRGRKAEEAAGGAEKVFNLLDFL